MSLLLLYSVLGGLACAVSAAPTTSGHAQPRIGPFRSSHLNTFDAAHASASKGAADELRPADATNPVRYVENSGVCETTPGVYQASGYVDIASDQHAFFWYFAARHNPDTAPVTIWLNGGPGASSLIGKHPSSTNVVLLTDANAPKGLFQELGPCRIKLDSSGVELNPNSWNEVSNLLFIDQPIGTGFSYGTTNVINSDQAAQALYKVLQGLLKDTKFSKLRNSTWGLATESYGVGGSPVRTLAELTRNHTPLQGHYGPVIAAYILAQNAQAAANGNIVIPFKTLVVGNGITQPLAQYPGYVQYAKSNPYHQLVSDSTISRANATLYKSGGCLDQIRACQSSKNANTCRTAGSYCENNVLSALIGPYDYYDVRAKRPDPYPPAFDSWLNGKAIRQKIGAETTYNELSNDVNRNFAIGGDEMLDSSPQLSTVIDAGVRVHILCGDADYILNYFGVEAQVAQLKNSVSALYNSQKLAPWTVDGKPAGYFINAKQLSYTRNAQAGHEVPAYGTDSLAKGRAALVMFTQVVSGKPISNT